MPIAEVSQVLGNLGEFVGAIAVVATLIYLATQVRQANLATTISSEQRRHDATQNLLLMPIHQAPLREAMSKVGEFSPAHSVVVAKLCEGFPVHYDEAILITNYWSAFFSLWEEYYSNPLRDERRWRAIQRRVRVHLQPGRAPFFVWQEFRNLYDPAFVEHFEGLIAESGT